MASKKMESGAVGEWREWKKACGHVTLISRNKFRVPEKGRIEEGLMRCVKLELEIAGRDDDEKELRAASFGFGGPLLPLSSLKRRRRRRGETIFFENAPLLGGGGGSLFVLKKKRIGSKLVLLPPSPSP